MLGAIVGDIVGSAYEFSRFKGKTFTPLFHRNARFTDDTVCTVAVADALIAESDPQKTMIRWCNNYAENGGWGRQFALWFLSDNPSPYGSWGNGAAMRIAPAGLWARSDAEALQLADQFSAITHNHQEAMQAAQAVALAIFWGREGRSVIAIKQQLMAKFPYDLNRTPDEIRPTYVRSERAKESVPEAIVCALNAVSFEDALRNSISLGGDSDTIAAIAGGIAEVIFGIPDDIKNEAMDFLPDDMKSVVFSFYDQIPNHSLIRLPQ